MTFFLLASGGALSWQRHHADVLRQRNATLRAQLAQNEQTASELDRQNEATRKLLEQHQTALLDLQSRLAAAAKLSAASSAAASASVSNGWRDDLPFVRLSKGQLNSLSVAIIARDATGASRLATPAATLLGLNAEEWSAVNEAIRNVCEEYLALELAHAPQTAKYQRSCEVIETVFAIPALATEGAELKRAFTEALTTALGQTRTDLIMHYGHDVFCRQLAVFGENV